MSNRNLIGEFIVLFIFLVIAIPVCVSASNNYNKRERYINNMDSVYVSINNASVVNDDKVISNKIVTINNKNRDSVMVNLGFRILKYTNSYTAVIGDKMFNLDDLEYSDDGKYLYYNFGVFEVDDVSNLKFQLILNNDVSYDSSVSYSFFVKGI